MTIILNNVCSNPFCYNKPTVKKSTKAGALLVEVQLCSGCEQRSKEVDLRQREKLQHILLGGMQRYRTAHSLQGKVPDEMITMAINKILEETINEVLA